MPSLASSLLRDGTTWTTLPGYSFDPKGNGAINGWGECANPSSCPADIAPPGPPVGDDVVDVLDLLLVINNWS